jgi:hypothetical protein
MPGGSRDAATDQGGMTVPLDQDISQHVRSEFAAMAPDALLRSKPSALMGVGPSGEAALASIDIRSIFDLAASRIFAAASALLDLQRNPSMVEARLNAVASDVAEAPVGLPVRELADQPISILRGVPDAAELAAALDVQSVRDLALWPPYKAAKGILSAGFFPAQAGDFDPDAPAELLPKAGVYPTERVFFRKLVIDMLPDGGSNSEAIESAKPIDLSAALGAQLGFGRLATGAADL